MSTPPAAVMTADTYLTPEERDALDKIDIHALLREVTGETIEDQVERFSNTAMKFFREMCATRKSLMMWQRFASYCRCCAQSGESNPMDFDTFKEMPVNQDTKGPT